jgi:hypothetical protein
MKSGDIHKKEKLRLIKLPQCRLGLSINRSNNHRSDRRRRNYVGLILENVILTMNGQLRVARPGRVQISVDFTYALDRACWQNDVGVAVYCQGI